LLEERIRQAAPQLQAASRSAAAFSPLFASGVSAFVSAGVQDMDS